MGLATIASIAIFSALIYALYQRRVAPTNGLELYNTDNKPAPDGLANLPRDYAGIPRDVPKLGPPLPGDLGRAILNAQGGGPAGQPTVDPEIQRAAQEQEAARTSRLFSTTNVRERPETPATLGMTTDTEVSNGVAATGETPGLDPDSLQNMQDHKVAFLNASVDRRTVSPDHLQNAASRYVVQAGSVIPAALITGIRSDLPGQVTAQVTEDVYDSPTGKYLLIPQGAKLIGQYDSQVAFGQDRVLLVWTRLILPNGRSIILEREPAADTQGYADVEDQVDNHWTRLFTAAILSSLLGVGSELGSSGNTNNQNGAVQALRRGSGDTLNQTGQQVVRRNLNIQPTLTIRPGFPVRVIVNRDLVLMPYQQ
jgi:type IV secretion system protein TrbI